MDRGLKCTSNFAKHFPYYLYIPVYMPLKLGITKTKTEKKGKKGRSQVTEAHVQRKIDKYLKFPSCLSSFK